MPNKVQKRQSSRISVFQTATLMSQQMGTITGEIQDFSTDGVLFTLAQPTLASSLLNQPITIAFRSQTANAVQYLVMGRVVRIFDRSIGIAVDNFPAEAYRVLVLSVNQSAKVKSTRKSAYRKAQIAESMERCYSQFRLFISRVIEHFYTRLNVSSEDDTTSSNERWLLYSAHALLAKRRNEIEQAFFEDHVREMREVEFVQPDRKPSLALVDMEEFDDWLAVSQLINQLNQDYSSDVGQFELRYAALQGMALNTKSNPFGAHRIYWAFHTKLAENKLDNQLRMLLYNLFNESVLLYFKDFYVDLNQILNFVEPVLSDNAADVAKTEPDNADVGAASSPPFTNTTVEPQLNKKSFSRSPAISINDYLYGNSDQVGTDGTANPLASVQQSSKHVSLDFGLNQMLWRFNYLLNNAGAVQSYQAVTDAVMGYQSANRFATGSMPEMVELSGSVHSKRPFAAPYVQQDGASDSKLAADYLTPILHFLNGIQQQRAANNQDNELKDVSIKKQLMAVLAEFQNVAQLTPLLQAINSFDAALATPVAGQENTDISALLKKIELPLVKLTLLDENFSRSNTHPAQQTVNLIERFYAAADDQGKLFDHRLQRLLNLMVDQIVDRFEEDTSVFAEVNKVLMYLLAPIEEARKNKVTQIQQAFESRKNTEYHSAEEAVLVGMDAALTNTINLLCLGDWLAVMDNNIAIACQIVCLESGNKQFVLTNRSATVVREFSRNLLTRELAEGQVQVLPEYDLPFMARSAYKDMLSVYEQVCQKATHDPISGLVNQKGLMTHLDTVFGYDADQKRRIVLCVLVFDRMSLLDYNCASAEAEAAFSPFLATIAEQIRPTDTFARIGENMFAILMRDSDLDIAQPAMRAIMASIETQRIRCDDKYFVVSANIGISQLTDLIDSPHTLMCTAGAACVAAQKLGNYWIKNYKPDSKTIRQERSMYEWAGAIDQVLHDGLLFLRCQKIQPIDTSKGNLPHYEILLGIDESLAIDPQGFVLAAEKWRRSADIDLWVLQNTIEWLTAQGDRLNNIAGVSINLSAHSLNNQKIWAYIEQMLQTNPLLAHKIIFEITETAIIQNLETAQQFITATRAYGCRFSLDDFGSGYNSFAYLRNLSLDYLKIDGLFVRDIVASATDFALVKSMHEVGRALGLQTIAEYVENDDIMTKLRELGIDYAQGYGVEASKAIRELIL